MHTTEDFFQRMSFRISLIAWFSLRTVQVRRVVFKCSESLNIIWHWLRSTFRRNHRSVSIRKKSKSVIKHGVHTLADVKRRVTQFFRLH